MANKHLATWAYSPVVCAVLLNCVPMVTVCSANSVYSCMQGYSHEMHEQHIQNKLLVLNGAPCAGRSKHSNEFWQVERS